jgi:F-type H+-transporting ATPase subunit gamma
MSDTLEILRRKIDGAGEVASVVSAMKAVAGSSIGQYENAVTALNEYSHAVKLALSLCFRHDRLPGDEPVTGSGSNEIGVIVFGSDQGLVGQFNDRLADFVVSTLAKLTGQKKIWAVGQRMLESLKGINLDIAGNFELPGSVSGITPLIVNVVTMMEPDLPKWRKGGFYLIHNRPESGSVYVPVAVRLLPLDRQWRSQSANTPWPTKVLPELVGDVEAAIIREYLFITIFQACAESLASENASRLAAMQRAEKNVADLLGKLNQKYHRLRQSSIDEELFDVISGFEAINAKRR